MFGLILVRTYSASKKTQEIRWWSVQVSDWSRRPLAASQMHYAALDAAVQVHILHRLCTQGQLSEADLVEMYSDWPSSNPKKARTSQAAEKKPSEDPRDDEDDDQQRGGGAGGGKGGSRGVTGETSNSSSTAGGTDGAGSVPNGGLVSHMRSHAHSTMGSDGCGSGNRNCTAMNSICEHRGSGEAVMAMYTSDTREAAVRSRSVRKRRIGALRGAQQSCAHFLSHLTSSHSHPARSVAAYSTAPQRATTSSAVAFLHATPLTQPWSAATSMHGVHASQERTRIKHIASMAGAVGRGNRCSPQNRLKMFCSRSSTGSHCLRRTFKTQQAGPAVVHAWKPNNVGGNQLVTDVYQYGLGCLCVRQFGRLSGRWFCVASAMMHAVNSSRRVPVFCRPPRLRQPLRGVRYGAHMQLLKM